jgi:hypothetical protein
MGELIDGRSTDQHQPNHRLAWRKCGDFLQVQVSGDIDAQAIRIAYWQEIAATARRQGFRKLLVIDRKKGQPASPEDLLDLARALLVEREHFDRVAVVEPTDAFLPAIEHAEIIGREHGINVRVFGSMASAELWLRLGSTDDPPAR